MARKLRLEFPGACYHVINRGNYRTDIFRFERTKAAFEACLFEACEKSGWLLHAFVVMRNHYHLAIETPEGNLVAGMKWLQATFANRFNHWRQERGHVFQGRYKALLVEEGPARGSGRVSGGTGQLVTDYSRQDARRLGRTGQAASDGTQTSTRISRGLLPRDQPRELPHRHLSL